MTDEHEALIAAARAATPRSAAARAALDAIEIALRAGWDSPLAGALVNGYVREFTGDRDPAYVQRHLAIATAVGYLERIADASRSSWAADALAPPPLATASAAEAFSTLFAPTWEHERPGQEDDDLGSGLTRRQSLIADEHNLDARLILGLADRRLDTVIPNSRRQFALLLDRAHALLVLSEQGTRAGPLRAARASLGRAARVLNGLDSSHRGGLARLELLVLQQHDALGDSRPTNATVTASLHHALNDALASGEDSEPIVAHALRHLEARNDANEADASMRALARRLLSVDLPPHVHTRFRVVLFHVLGALSAQGDPTAGEEIIALSRQLRVAGAIDDASLATMLMLAAAAADSSARVRALLEETESLSTDLPIGARFHRLGALVTLSRLSGDPAPAMRAITLATSDTWTDAYNSTVEVIRTAAVRSLVDLGDARARAQLDILATSPAGIMDTQLAVLVDMERRLERGDLLPEAATGELIDALIAHGRELAIWSVHERLGTPAGAVFPLLRAAIGDEPAVAIVILERGGTSAWAAVSATKAAHVLSGSDRAAWADGRAVELLEAALASGEESPTIRQALGARLLVRYHRDHEPADLDRAEALLLPEGSKRELAVGSHREQLLAAFAHRDGVGFSSRTRGLQTMLLQDTVYDDEDDLGRRLWAARAYQEVNCHIFWGAVWSPFRPLADALEQQLDRVGPEVLAAAQGLASRSAFAAASGGNPRLAVEIAERGQGLQAARALQRLGREATGLYTDHGALLGVWQRAKLRLERIMHGMIPELDSVTATALSRPPTRLLERAEALTELAGNSAGLAEAIAEEERARTDLEAAAGFIVPAPDNTEIIAHLHRRAAQLSYVITTSWGGIALTVRRNGSIAITDLPDLTESACTAWQQVLEQSVPSAELRAAVVRGADTQPDLADAASVLTELSNALRPLADELATRDEAVELVLTGITGMLPIVAALQETRADDQPWFELSAAASARLHITAQSRAALLDQADGIVAITDPSAASGDGTLYPALPYAQREGARLTKRYGGTHHTGDDATAAIARTALRAEQRVLHFAVHGESDAEDPGRSRVYLAGADDAAVTAAEMSREVVASRLVYLGACWTGRAGSRLPDEAIGFPTLLLQSGAGAVVAPLWPVEDGASFTFASEFYRSWLEHGSTTARALADAMRLTRERHPTTPTWAAFSLYGA